MNTPRSPHCPHCLHRKLHVSVTRRTAVTGGGAVSVCRKQVDTNSFLHDRVAQRRAYLPIRSEHALALVLSIACNCRRIPLKFHRSYSSTSTRGMFLPLYRSVLHHLLAKVQLRSCQTCSVYRSIITNAVTCAVTELKHVMRVGMCK